MSPLEERKRDLVKCEDMRLHSERALQFVGSMSLEAFQSNVLVQDAVIRCVEVIGEAARQVSERTRDEVQVFDGTGVFLTAWGSSGAGLGQLSSPTDLCVDGAGRVYVVDSGNSRIQVFDPHIAAVGEDVQASGLQLAPASPNPSQGLSKLRFDLARESSNVSLVIYDVGGRRVAGWQWPALTAGSHQVEWNGLAENGQPAGAGLLFCRLSASGQTRTQKLVHLR